MVKYPKLYRSAILLGIDNLGPMFCEQDAINMYVPVIAHFYESDVLEVENYLNTLSDIELESILTGEDITGFANVATFRNIQTGNPIIVPVKVHEMLNFMFEKA